MYGSFQNLLKKYFFIVTESIENIRQEKSSGDQNSLPNSAVYVYFSIYLGCIHSGCWLNLIKSY